MKQTQKEEERGKMKRDLVAFASLILVVPKIKLHSCPSYLVINHSMNIMS